MKRNSFLDVLKGICILLVILTHFDWVEAERLKYLFPYWMNPAVPIFMIITGYVSTEAFGRRSVTTLKQAYSFKIVFDKALRFTLPLLLIYLVEILLKTLVLHQSLTVGQALYQLFVGGWGPGSYYYCYMMQLIVVFPLIYIAIRKWDFAGLLLCAAVNVLYEVLKIPFGMPSELFRLISFRYIFALSIGCYFSIGTFKIKKWMGVLSFLLGATFLYAICYGGYQPRVFYLWSRTSMLAVLYIAPLAYLLIKKGTWECKPLAMLGKASYSIFLVQMVYFHIFGDVKGTFFGMLITYAVCIVFGLLFYKVESVLPPNRKKHSSRPLVHSTK